MSISRAACIVCLLAATTSATVARADAPTREAKAEAKRLYEEGTKSYNLAEYAKAVEKYRAAYSLIPEPSLLFNIAQSYRLIGDFKLARTFYKNYLNSSPDAPNRKSVEEKISEMNDLIAKSERAATAPPTAPMSPETTGTPPTAGQPEAPRPPATATAATTSTTSTTSTPPTGATAAPTSNAVSATAPPSSDRKPLYKKWWLWTAVGGVVVVGVAIGLGVGLSGSSGPQPLSPPTSDFGNSRIFGLGVK